MERKTDVASFDDKDLLASRYKGKEHLKPIYEKLPDGSLPEYLQPYSFLARWENFRWLKWPRTLVNGD